MYLLSGAA